MLHSVLKGNTRAFSTLTTATAAAAALIRAALPANRCVCTAATPYRQAFCRYRGLYPSRLRREHKQNRLTARHVCRFCQLRAKRSLRFTLFCIVCLSQSVRLCFSIKRFTLCFFTFEQSFEFFQELRFISLQKHFRRLIPPEKQPAMR